MTLGVSERESEPGRRGGRGRLGWGTESSERKPSRIVLL